MKIKLGFASLFTLGIITSFVFALVLLFAYFNNTISATFLIVGTILMNFIIWLVSPFFNQLIYAWIYKCKFYKFTDFKNKDPELAAYIEKICLDNKIKPPRIGIIDDDNPTAFTFGSGAYNARIVFTKGLYTYLSKEEREAVIAHELGHIVNRDFIIMTVAATLVQIMYLIYRLSLNSAARSSGGKKKGSGYLMLIGLSAVIFYWISSYLLLFLSRTREYYADEFAAKYIKHPDILSMSFIKIAYGIVSKPTTKQSSHLLDTTRNLGISDTKSAKNLGVVYNNLKGKQDKIDNVLLFDLVSPWAKILELSSTHPLTGKRIKALSKIAKKKGLTSIFDFEDVMRKEIKVDKKKLYNHFFTDLFVYFLPKLSVIVPIVLAVALQDLTILLGIPFVLGFGILFKTFYMYSNAQAKPSTLIDLMQDIYASPLRGRPVMVEGEVIGRGIAGLPFSEDMMMQDKTGLMYLNYESAIPFFGNLIFAWKKVKAMIGRPVKAQGWFFRGLTQRVDLKIITSDGKAVKSYVRMWMFIQAGIVFLLGGVFIFYYFL